MALLGTGHMGSALIRGVLGRMGGTVSLLAWDHCSEALQGLPSAVRVEPPDAWFSGDNAPELVVLAVKPADMGSALAALRNARPAPGVLWVSLAAGVRIHSIEQALGPGAHVCRVMPNMPALIGLGASAFALNAACDERDEQKVQRILDALGVAIRVQEAQMNAVTGLSGSGPAYVYLFIEALIEGGVSAGLSYDDASRLAVQTVRGAAEMLVDTARSPAALKAAVMSPGGTTVRGLMALEKSGLKSGVIQAVLDAAARAEELGSV